MTRGEGEEAHKRNAHAKICKADCFVFDVGQTIVKEDVLEEIAKFVGRGDLKEIQRLVEAGNSNARLLEESLHKCIEQIRPSKQEIEDFQGKANFTIQPGASELIAHLKRNKVEVYLISNGFECLIYPIAQQLNIAERHIFANHLEFNFKGDYLSYDTDTNYDLHKTNGKHLVLRQLLNKSSELGRQINMQHSHKNIVLVGDGATDMIAGMAGTFTFIAYGGVKKRQEVWASATYGYLNFNDIRLAYEGTRKTDKGIHAVVENIPKRIKMDRSTQTQKEKCRIDTTVESLAQTTNETLPTVPIVCWESKNKLQEEARQKKLESVIPKVFSPLEKLDEMKIKPHAFLKPYMSKGGPFKKDMKKKY